LLFEIWRTSLELNRLIRQFDPSHDDVERAQVESPAEDPRQMSLMDLGIT
jgi:hypothetical protein